MKKFLAILLAVSLILITPAFAAEVSQDQITDPMDIKAKGIDNDTATEILENNTTNDLSQNEISDDPGTDESLYNDSNELSEQKSIPPEKIQLEL